MRGAMYHRFRVLELTLGNSWDDMILIYDLWLRIFDLWYDMFCDMTWRVFNADTLGKLPNAMLFFVRVWIWWVYPQVWQFKWGTSGFFEMDLAGPSSGKISCFTALHLNILGHCRTASQHNTTTFLLFVTVVFSKEDGDLYDRHLVVRKTFLEVVEENPSGKGLAGGKWGLNGERLQGLTGRHSDAKQNRTTKYNSWKKASEQTYMQYIHDHS